MKRLCLLLLLGVLTAALPAQTYFEASETPSTIINCGKRVTQARDILVDGRHAVLCSQTPDQGAFIEIDIGGPSFRMRLTDAYSGRTEAEIYLPEDANIRSFSLRLVDANGETFQLPFPKKLTGLTGWQTLSLDIDFSKENPASWGRTCNRRYDKPLRFSSVAASPADPAKPRAVAIRRLAFVPTKAQPGFDLDTNCPVHVLRPQDDSRLALLIENPCDQPMTLTGTLTLTDAWKRQLHTAPLNQTLQPRQTLRLPLPAPDRLGVFYLDIAAHDGVADLTRRLSFARLNPAGPTPGRSSGFIFGVQSHALRYGPREQELDALAAGLMGAKVFRTSSNWSLAQPSPDNPPDFSVIDAMLDRYEAQGLEPQIGFLNTPKWAVDPNWKPFSPTYVNRFGNRGFPSPDLKLYGRYVEQFMTHYRGRVRFVESWNEPDLLSFANFGPDTYIEMMKVFYASVKKAAPEALIMTGGYTSILQPFPSRSTHPDHMAYTMNGAKGHYDIHAFHAHGRFQNYAPQIVQLHQMQRRIGVNVPWWANETAESSSGRGETIQAATLFKKLLYTFAMNGIGYNWYDLRNDGYDPKEPEHNFGLLTRDFYPKAAYATYNTLATLYAHAAFLKPLLVSEDFHAYLFQARNGDLLIPCWNTRENLPGRLLTLAGVTGALSVIDIFGNETPVDAAQGIAFIDSTSWPVTIRLAGQRHFPTLHGNAFSCPRQFAVHPARDNTLELSFDNPLDSPLELALKAAPSAGHRLVQDTFAVTVPPRQRHTFTLQLAADAQAKPSRQAAVTLTLTLAGTLTQTHTIPLKTIDLLPATFAVRSGDSIRSLVVNAPDLSHLQWKGPEDLSADARLECRDNALILALDVTDDQHVQPHRGFNVWQGDNVQLALQLPGQPSCWEIGLTHLADGTSEAFVFKQPPKTPTDAVTRIRLTTARDDAHKRTSYRATIPLDALGLSPQDARQPFAFTFIVNDNDSDCRESYLFLTPGLGSGAHQPERYRLIAIE